MFAPCSRIKLCRSQLSVPQVSRAQSSLRAAQSSLRAAQSFQLWRISYACWHPISFTQTDINARFASPNFRHLFISA